MIYYVQDKRTGDLILRSKYKEDLRDLLKQVSYPDWAILEEDDPQVATYFRKRRSEHERENY